MQVTIFDAANNVVTTSGVDFWKGGAGIYNGDGSTLTLLNSTVRDNQVQGGDGVAAVCFRARCQRAPTLTPPRSTGRGGRRVFRHFSGMLA